MKEPVSRQQGQKERPPPWLPPPRRGEQGGGGVGAQSPSRRRVSRAGAVGITVRSCLGAGEGFQGSLLLNLTGKPGEKFLAAAFVVEESRERRDVGHGGAALLLPSALEPSFSSSSPRSLSRMLGNIKSDLQLATLPPPPRPQHREVILSHLNPPLPKELQQKRS